MSEVRVDNPPKAPSPGYYATLGFGLAAIAVGAIAFGAVLIMRRGGDPIDAVDSWGLPGMAVAFGLGYAARLMFWAKAPAWSRPVVRLVIIVSLLASLLMTVAAIFMLLASSGGQVSRIGEEIGWISGGSAALLQIAAVTWLVRYRRL